MGSPLLARPGAVPAEPPDTGVAAHYGDPLAEQRVLSDDVGVVDRSNRGLVVVRGPDRLTLLHNLTTQHFAGLAPWTVCEGLVLSPHGHIQHHFIAVDDGKATWLDVEPGTGAGLAHFFTSMRFMLEVEVRDESNQWATISLIGPGVARALWKFVQDQPPEPGSACPLPDFGLLRRMPWPGKDAADLIVPSAATVEVVDRTGLPPAGMAAYEALRVEAHRPRLGHETDHRTIPHEVGWLNDAVHLNKGCYRGQETVARVKNLGRPPRRLVLLHFNGSKARLPERGAPVVWADRQVGFVGTAATHYALGSVALALVKRNTPCGQTIEAGGLPALAESVVEV